MSDNVNRDKVTFIDTYVNFLTEMANLNAIKLIDIKQEATEQDPIFIKLEDLIINHTWHT